MARLGLPAITLWQQLGGNDSNFVFYDDNQTMIGVIRTGKNPTMRHLERTHGINIGWMHSIFQEGYVSLAYEVNAKMAADIHTKVVQGLRFLDSRMCCIVPVFPARRVCRSMIASDSVDSILVVKFPRMFRGPPSTLPPGRYLRSTWILREGQWRQIEDKAQIPDTPAKLDGYVERAVFQFHPVRAQLRPAAVSTAVRSLPEPPLLGECFVRALPATWRSVVAALARAIHGGYQGFTLPLRFNGRPYSQQIPCVGDTRWTTVVEDVWEHMAKKRREMQGHGEAIVPRVVEFQENHKGGLIIQFHDYDGGLVHTYKDPSSEFQYRIAIKDALKRTTVWTVIGVDENNWWNEYAPGMDCMKELAPGPHYDPIVQVNVLGTGKQVDDATCSYLFDVAKSRQQTSNSVIFIGAGVLGRSSWLDRQIVEKIEKVEFRTDYPWEEVAQTIARKASQWKTQVIVEVPPEAQVQQTKQYKMLSEDDAWTSIKIDGCTHGQRMVLPGPSGIHTIGCRKVGWEYLTANAKIWPKLSDKFRSDHTHVCQRSMLTKVVGPARYLAGCSMP
eukprot:s920_g12.t2